MTRNARAAAVVVALVAGLSACGGSSGGALSDSAAVTASGAKNCKVNAGVIMVRSEFECKGGQTVTTFASSAMRQAMAQAAGSAGFQHVVKQSDNWMLTEDN